MFLVKLNFENKAVRVHQSGMLDVVSVASNRLMRALETFGMAHVSPHTLVHRELVAKPVTIVEGHYEWEGYRTCVVHQSDLAARKCCSYLLLHKGHWICLNCSKIHDTFYSVNDEDWVKKRYYVRTGRPFCKPCHNCGKPAIKVAGDTHLCEICASAVEMVTDVTLRKIAE